jgi:hypothetical protein
MYGHCGRNTWVTRYGALQQLCNTVSLVQPARFVEAVNSLTDPLMRVLALTEALTRDFGVHLPVDVDNIWVALDAWVHVFADVIATARNRVVVDSTSQLRASIALETLTLALASPTLSYVLRSALYDRSTLLAKPQLARLLFTAGATDALTVRRLKSSAAERAQKWNQRANARSGGPARDRALSLGERKSLARTHSRDDLALIAKDPHPSVVAILLDNPHIVEADVVRIASTRPTMAEALELIANHPRWRLRVAVKRALVYNPHAAVATAIRMMTTLPVAEIRDIRNSGALSAQLLTHADWLLAMDGRC